MHEIPSALDSSTLSDPLLTLDKVTLNFGTKKFGPFDLKIGQNEKVVVLGPSGAGKSTLLKLSSSECQPSAGELVFKNRPLKNWCAPSLSCHRAVLPQSHEVSFGLTVELVISLGRVARHKDDYAAQIISMAAKQAMAQTLLNRNFDTLSGGEKARVQLARVFAQLWDVEGGLLLVDEPLASLDPGLQLSILESIFEFAYQRGHAVVAVLHDINQALQNFDRALLIKNGMLVDDLSLVVNPLNHYVTSLEKLYDMSLDSVVTASGYPLVVPRCRVKK